MNYLQENNKMSKNEILKHITKTKINSIELFKNIFVNTENMITEMKTLKSQEDLRLYNYQSVKKISVISKFFFIKKNYKRTTGK